MIVEKPSSLAQRSLNAERRTVIRLEPRNEMFSG